MRRLYMVSLALGAIGCGVVARAADETAEPKADELRVGQMEWKAVPGAYLKFAGGAPGLNGFLADKPKTKRDPVFYGRQGMMMYAQYTFRANLSKDGTRTGSISIDWNRNRNFDDDGEMAIPAEGELTKAKVTLGGQEREVALSAVRVKKNKGYSLYLRPTEWLAGEVAFGKSVKRVALLDADLDGLNTKGPDLMVVDKDGDGRISFQNRTFESQGYFFDTMFMGTAIIDAIFDKKAKRLELKKSDNLGTLKVDHPAPEPTSVMVRIPMGRTIQNLGAENGECVLPAREYRGIDVIVQGKKGKLKYVLRLAMPKCKVEKGETLTLSMPKPTGMKPKIRFSRGNLLVKDSIAYAELPVGLKKIDGISINRRRAPAPKIEVYKGDEKLTQGTMKYG